MNAEQINDDQQEQPGTIPESGAAADDYSSGFDAFASKSEPKEADDYGGDHTAEEIKKDPAEKSAEARAPQATEDNVENSQKYRSMMGRLDKEREANRLLKEQLQQQTERRLGHADDYNASAYEKATIPDDIKEDVDAFKKQFPEYSEIIESKGRTGDRIRKLLSDYGAEVAAVQADNAVLKQEIRSSKDAIAQQLGDYAGLSHEHQVYAAHPDFADMLPDQKGVFFNEMEEWIDSLPRVKGNEMRRVFEEGSTKETIKLFADFKAHKKNKSQQNQTNLRRQQAINDGMAVPSSARGAHRTVPVFKPDDYSGGFADACRKKG